MSNKLSFYKTKDVKTPQIGTSDSAGIDFFIPNEYKLLFKQLFPNQKIEENDSGFITKIPFDL